ncbi:MAG: hypothetical protein JWN04_2822 [Myxococcaceae bacterium]|nr:hypothetical protein [Myxococcaceae bacterium]
MQTFIKVAFTVVLVVHGLVHVLGFLKAFGLAQLAQLTLPISRSLGVLWLLAGLGMLGTAFASYAWPSSWWILGSVSLVLSQLAIVSSWQDARFGSAANALLLLGVAWAFLSAGPLSLRAQFARQVALGLSRSAAQPLVEEADLDALPAPVQRYLRYVGVVGQAHVRNFRARLDGRIRSGPGAAWMPLRAEQYNFVDRPTRLFSLQARMFGLPVEGLHAYVNGEASMRIELLALLPVVNARGAAFTAAETVTLFNDMCVMAPATLIDPTIRWEPVDELHVRASFSAAGNTIAATLVFDAEGRLVNFVSDDRPALNADGVTFNPQRWSTPLSDYRPSGPYRLASRGEARYRAPAGEYTYGEFTIEDIKYNVGPRD